MGSNRRGNIRKRGTRTRQYDLGFYVIITDTDKTEKNYFEGFLEKIPPELKDRITIKVVKTSTKDLIKTALTTRSEDAQYRKPCIIFDRDQVKDFDDIVKKADKLDVFCGWSNPCFEIFLMAYFGKMPSMISSVQCCQKFSEEFQKRTGQEYSKADNRLYEKMCKYGDEKTAITIAAEKKLKFDKNGITIASQMQPCSMVYELLQEINAKIEGKKERV